MNQANPVWVTKDGKSMPVTAMSTEHLRNAARFLRRQARAEEAGYWQAGMMIQGEQANLAWENAATQMDEYVTELRNKAALLEDELDRREQK